MPKAEVCKKILVDTLRQGKSEKKKIYFDQILDQFN